ncbi:WS/DGAT domain-containing protein [Aldersonia sp. NBC_00410]|uniref:wax ester/triacylglycerol synthase domain-containing protein n=1 Tax=Aldersonia sp. NBC_00410 TaxID=2975954 RepID=UPI00225839BE|nr:wax ester/triacylglycerol synthase domain-containing protein [Aldersonia sp. NBC_00410]MCX5045328.1 WS/DGAT domain-containing protein [Aldersonia sp. NBC_00410]
MERFTGSEALFLNMEDANTPMHTLKVAVLDSSRRGRAITLDELRAAVQPYLGLVPRSTQRVTSVRGFGARPFWVDDPDFDLAAHLDEVTLLTGEDLDPLCARLAERKLDRARPLWAMTLVHGLPGGRQAVVVRVHHAICDGLAALNTMIAATAPDPGAIATQCAPRTPVHATPAALRRSAVVDAVQSLRGLGGLAGELGRSRRRAAEFGRSEDLPPRFGARRTGFNTPSGADRVCVSASLDFGAIKSVADHTGAKVNGVLHAVVAGAVRSELLARGESPDRPSVATFGVAADLKSKRRWGNAIATASVYLRTELADPAERLEATSRSCDQAVRLRRSLGFDLTERTTTYTARIAPRLRALFADRLPRIVNNITTANVSGPAHTRWIGDIEVVDWISFAVAVAPADVNLTAYSYAGRLSVGIVATPESLPDPPRFACYLEQALDELSAAVSTPERAYG